MNRLLFLILFSLLGLLQADDKAVKLAAMPSLSPDGKVLAFNWNGDIWKVSTKGGEAVQLTSHPAEETSPVFSPDGTKIAFVSSREGRRQVYVMPVDGGKPKRIGFHSEGYTVIDWYSDGKSVLVSAVRDNYGRNASRFYRLYLERQAEVEVFNAGVVTGDLSPDDKKVLFSREGAPLYRKGYTGSQSSQVWLYDSDTKDFSAPVKGDFAYRSPMWNKDGSAFFYVSNESGAFNIWSMDLKTRAKKQLTSHKDDGTIRPAVSRNGEFIVYRYLFDFYLLDTDSGKSRKIDITVDRDIDFINKKPLNYKSTSDADFSSDGLEIVFTASYDLWVMDTILKEPVRITETNEVEKSVIFSKDNKSIFCIRDNGVKTAVLKIERAEKKFWWQCRKFKETVLVESNEQTNYLSQSPDGKSLAYIRGNGDLYILDIKTKKEKRFLESWDVPSYDWSPDSKWIAYAVEDNNYNNDVWIAPVDGSQEPYNVSYHPDWDGNPTFSPDGKILAFTSNRFDSKYDICYVYLTKEKAEDSARDRKLEKAVAAMKKRPKPTPKKVPEPQPKTDKPAQTETAAKAGNDIEIKKKQSAVKKPKAKGLKIDFEGLNDRIRFIKSEGSEYRLFWSPEGTRLGFISSNGSKKATLKVQFPDKLKPAPMLAADIVPVKWIKNNDAILCLSKGVPAALAKGKVTPYSFTASLDQNIKEVNRQVFRHIWRKMRDSYYDEKLNNRDWDNIRKKYEEMAAAAPDATVFDRTIYMLLGELNGSHLGYRSRVGIPNYSTGRETTAHIGAQFDMSYQGPGLKISRIIKGSSASLKKSLLKAGEIILSIDGTKCSTKDDLTLYFNGPLNRDIYLKVKSAEGVEREVIIRPQSYSSIRGLLYDEWLDDNREKTHKLSNDKVGYLHVARMQWAEFNKFKEEVFKEGDNREGLIIDVRDNGGGFTADHLLSVLNQPKHAICVPRGGERGYPFSRRVYSNWSKPVVVLCNQNSFSNAEIFSHAVKTLKRGKLIGVPTAGGVISTGSANILDKGTLRIPFRGWYVAATGEDMELHGAVPDIILWPLPGELESGNDSQLDKAIEVIQEEIKAFAAREKVKLRKASDR